MKKILMAAVLSFGSSAFAMDLSEVTCEVGLVHRDGTDTIVKSGTMNQNAKTGTASFDTFRPGPDGYLADDYRFEVRVSGSGRANILFYDKVSGTETLSSMDIVDGNHIYAYVQNSKGLIGKKDITRIFLECKK